MIGGREEVIVGQMGIVGGRGMAAVPEHLADQRQVLDGHDGVARHGMLWKVGESVRSCRNMF